MKPFFSPIAAAFTFSPTLPQLIRQAAKLREAGNAKLFLIHAGIIGEENSALLHELLSVNRVPADAYELICRDTDPASLIREVCRQKKISLLIIGALMKEGLFSYYTGTLARNLMRNVPASMLILSCQPDEELTFSHICATVDFSKEGTQLLHTAYDTARLFGSEKLTLLRELLVPGLAMTVHDSGSKEETGSMRQVWEEQERLKINMLVKELHFSGLPVKTAIVYGRQGYEAKKYAEEQNVDLLVVPAPKKKLRLMDRIFQHDQEYLYQELPCSLLCLKAH